MKKSIIIFETIIFISQLLIWLLFPIENCKNYNCDGKLLGYLPIFIFVLSILYIINFLFYVLFIFQIFKKYKIIIFTLIIFFYNLFFCIIIFSKFGSNLINFTLLISFIQTVSNLILVMLYYKIYSKKIIN